MAFDIIGNILESIVNIVIAFGVNSEMRYPRSQMEPEKKKTLNAAGKQGACLFKGKEVVPWARKLLILLGSSKLSSTCN